MGFRFRRSVRLFPGVRLNFSKSGVSTSIGGRGLTANISKHGIRHTVGIPGSGLSFSTPPGTSRAESSDAGPHTLEGSGATRRLSGGAGCGCILVALLLLAAVTRCGGDATQPTAASTTDTSETAPVDPSAVSGDAPVFARGDNVYVRARSLNGRASPSSTSNLVSKLSNGQRLQVVGRSGKWLKVMSGATSMWILSSYVSSSRGAAARPLYSKPHLTKPSSRAVHAGSTCPCSESQVCIGPRGGRYCITSVGAKRYGR